jgi:uncharacterized protein
VSLGVKSLHPREDLVDALRAAALLGVLVVNAVSYGVFPEGTQVGTPNPNDSALATTVLTAVAFLFQGKAYPLLAFLFGYSLMRAMGERPFVDDVLNARRARMLRLIVLGALHGTFVYAGDILALYGVLGWLLAGCMSWRTGKMLRHARGWLVVAIVLSSLTAALMFFTRGEANPPGVSLVQSTGWAQYLAINASSFVPMWVPTLFFVSPELLAAMLAGAAVARLRWFTHRRWQASREKAWRWLLPSGLILSAAYAGFLAWSWQQPTTGWDWVAVSSSHLAGWTLSAGLALTLVRAWHAGPPAWLASWVPLGRYTLSLYLVNSVLLMVLFSGAGFKLPATTVMLLAYAVSLWLAARAVAKMARKAGWRGPFEAWLSGSKSARPA